MVRNWTPSIAPGGHDQTVYLVADDFGRIGRAWIEADYEGTDLETIIQDLMSGQYKNPVRVMPSIPRSAGQTTSQRTSPQKSGTAAISRCSMCHPLFRILLKDTKVAAGN
jgi:hypothetical protein